MRRREFITLLGGAATWPLAASDGERMRRIGVLMHTAADEPESQARLAAFMQGLQELGWGVGRNLRIDYRWSVGDAARLYKDAAELVALAPEVILGGVGATAAHFNGRAAPCPSSWHKASTRSVTVTSRVWRGQAATLPGSFSSNMAWLENGRNCSRRSRQE